MSECLKCDECEQLAPVPIEGGEEDANAHLASWLFVDHNSPDWPAKLHFCSVGCLRKWAERHEQGDPERG